MYVANKSPFSAPDHDVLVAARRADPLGWIQGAPLDGRMAYVPHVGLTTIREYALKHASKTRVVDADEHDLVVGRIEFADDRIAELEARIAELEAERESIAGLRKAGFTVQKIKGPRPKQEAV